MSIHQTCHQLVVAAAAADYSDSCRRTKPHSAVFDFAGPDHQIILRFAVVDFVGYFGPVHRRVPRLVAYSGRRDRFVVVYSACFVRTALHLAEAGFVDYSGPNCQIVPQSAVADLAGCFAQVPQKGCHWVVEYSPPAWTQILRPLAYSDLMLTQTW